MKLSLDIPSPAARGNGGPALDETNYEQLERIGRALHGDLWHAKLANDPGESERDARRWRAGQGQPSDETLRMARWYVRQYIKILQRIVEE